MIYLDTSFVGLIFLNQEHAQEANQILHDLGKDNSFASSRLLEVELIRLMRRNGLALDDVNEYLRELYFSHDVIKKSYNKRKIYLENGISVYY